MGKRSRWLLQLLAGVVMAFAPSGLEAARANEFGEIINTDFAQGRNSLCALRDQYGFLWVGTLTGLCCFDGNGLPVYPGSSGIVRSTEGSNITALFEYGDDIWFGGTPGLCLFNRAQNTTKAFPFKTKYGVVVSSPVQRIVRVGEDKIWILTNGQGFFVFDESDRSLTQNSRHGTFYSDLAVGSDGRVYVVTLDGYIQAFNLEGSFIGSERLPGFVADKTPLRIVASGRDVRVSNHNSIYRYETDNHTIDLEARNVVKGEINSMLPATDGKILLGTDDGVWSYDAARKEAMQLTPPYNTLSVSSLLDNRVTSMCYDTDSSLIVVTPTGGISHMLWKPSDFRPVSMIDDSGSHNVVSALTPSAGGKGVWVGSKTGLSHYDADAERLDRISLGSESDVEITSIAVSGDSVWLGTRHQGLRLYNTATGTVKSYTYDDTTPYAVISNNINKIYRTRAGEIFVLTNWGLCRYNPASDNFSTLPEAPSHTPFVAMQEDSHGRLWTATASNGLYMRERPEWGLVKINTKELGNRQVSMLFLDGKGTLWAVSQDNKLFYLDDNSGEFARMAVSMPKDYAITFLEEDFDGNLWAGTPDGLAKVDQSRNLTFYSYRSDSDVLPAIGASCRLPDGRIIFGSGSGFRTFNPKEMKSNNRMVRAYIQSLSFPYLENSDEELERLGLDILLYTRGEIRLPYSDNTFTLRLSAARTSDMPQVGYEYMLEGADKGWTSGSGPEVTYTDLRPGTYTFMLRPNFGSDAEVRRLKIIIMPPWYRTWLAYCVYVAAALLFVWVAVVLTRRRIRRHYQHRIDSLRIQKEREMFEAKMRFFVNLVHEIRTPLTLISLPLEQMAEEAEDGNASTEATEQHIRSMQRNVNYLLGITNQLLDFRKAEQDSEVRLAPATCNLNELLNDICRRFDHPMASAGKEITVDLPDEPVTAVIDQSKTDRIIMNLIGNAVKYSRHSVAVRLQVPAGGKIVISVSDDGPGISPEERGRIFDTYYQIGNDNVAASLGTGLGLAYAKLIARAHGGDISVGDNANGGATFTLTLPQTCGKPVKKDDVTVGDQIDVAPVTDGSGVTILLVDDNKELLTTVAGALGKKYSVVTAEDGTEALDVLEQRGDIDVIISDFMMPMMSGAELCRRVKSDMRFSHIPFIILTAKTDREAKEEGMEVGADVYIEKPFTIRQLVLQVANMLHTRELFYARMSAGEIAADEPVTEAPYLNRLDAEFMSTLNDYVRENISDEEFSIDVMARQMNMSRSSFYRKLKAVTGMTPVDYLKNFRLDYSARLLKEGVRVTEVAMMAGFTSSSYFAKCFKAKFGVIPKEYTASQKG